MVWLHRAEDSVNPAVTDPNPVRAINLGRDFRAEGFSKACPQVAWIVELFLLREFRQYEVIKPGFSRDWATEETETGADLK